MVNYMENLTTIQLEKSTRVKLERLKRYKRETYDEVVNKLIKIAEVLEKEKLLEKISPALMSEKALAREWLKVEEVEAWKDL